MTYGRLEFNLQIVSFGDSNLEACCKSPIITTRFQPGGNGHEEAVNRFNGIDILDSAKTTART